MRLVEVGLGDVVLVDVVEGLACGRALDIGQCASVLRFSGRVSGGSDYTAIAGSDVVVVTAGLPRQPGMSREDLLAANAQIVRDVARQVAKYAPGCVLMVVTNPLDAMAYLAKVASGFPPERVVGMAGILDAARFCSFIAEELGISPESIQALVLGGHGDTMVPLPRYTSVAGIPLPELLDRARIERLVERTRQGGAEIVGYLKRGSAGYAPAAAVVEMVAAVLLDKHKVLPCSAYLWGQYGEKDIFMGVPVKLGRRGVEEVLELRLEPAELEAFRQSAVQVRGLISRLEDLLR